MSRLSEENDCPIYPPGTERDMENDCSEPGRSSSSTASVAEASLSRSTGFTVVRSDSSDTFSEKSARSRLKKRATSSDSSSIEKVPSPVQLGSGDSLGAGKKEYSGLIPAFPGDCTDCAIFLKENYALIRKLNGVMDKRDRLLSEIKDLNEKNGHLSANLSKVIGERNSLLESSPNPRLFCNFTVTKMYVEWVEALKAELLDQRNRLSKTAELLEKSSASEKQLCTTVARLEDSLVFYRQIARQSTAIKSQSGDSELPKHFDALLENRFANRGFSGMPDDGHPNVKSDVYAALLEENDILRKRLLETEFERSRISRENQELRQELNSCRKSEDKTPGGTREIRGEMRFVSR